MPQLSRDSRLVLMTTRSPAGTVPHAHVHVIPGTRRRRRPEGRRAVGRSRQGGVLDGRTADGAVPRPEQVQFLRNVQRLLAEGLFVASYKFALVHALADLAVLKGDDSGAPLELDDQGHRRQVRGAVLAAVPALPGRRRSRPG